MIRTQISLTEKQMTRLRRAASARGVSIASVIREAVDRTSFEYMRGLGISRAYALDADFEGEGFELVS